MEAGARDRWLRLERKTEARDSLNNPVATWGLLTETWAEKRDVSDGERLRAQQLGAEITTRFTILWSPDVETLNGKDRAVCEGRTYEITGVKEIGTREQLEITCMAAADRSPATQPTPSEG